MRVVVLAVMLSACASGGENGSSPDSGAPLADADVDAEPGETGSVTNHLTDFTTPEGTYRRWINGPAWDFCADSADLYVTRTIVVPGNSPQSFLLEKLSSTRVEMCRDRHWPRMPPPPYARLGDDQIATIRRWIDEGAPNN